MRRWAVAGLLVALAGCADDGPVCTPLYRESRRCAGQLALLRCNAAGTGYECDPCAILPVCVEHADPTAEFGTRRRKTRVCRSSAECGGERSCCALGGEGGAAGCVLPNRYLRCLP